MILYDPTECNMPGFPFLNYLQESSQTHVHWVSDVIQPSHPVSLKSPFAFKLSQHLSLFQWANSSHQVITALELQLQHQSFQWLCWSPSGLTGLICLLSRDSQESSPAPQSKSINSLVLSYLNGLTLTSVHDYWINLVLNSKYEVLKQVIDRILNRCHLCK